MSSIDSGWLSPSGEFIQCDPYEHIATAEKLAGDKVPYFQADEYLMNHGWVKIYRGSYLDHKWHINWHGFLSEPQKSYLKPIFEDSIIDLYAYCLDDLEKELNNEPDK